METVVLVFLKKLPYKKEALRLEWPQGFLHINGMKNGILFPRCFLWQRRKSGHPSPTWIP
jgi:hypothetical protein